MITLVMRQPEDVSFICIYRDGKPFHGFKPDDDPWSLIEKLGTIGEYILELGEDLPEEEYERDWC